MPCCCEKGCCGQEGEKGLDAPDGCFGGNGGRRCICLPYDDPYVIASQILSIVAFCVSWVWWPSLVISCITMVLYQIIWCCRQGRASLLAAHLLSLLGGIGNIIIGIYLIVMWKDKWWCLPFTFENDDRGDDYYSYSYHYDDCAEKAWATVAFVDAALWLGAAYCLMIFVSCGRFDKWEERLNERENKASGGAAVEMAGLPAAVAKHTPAEATAEASPVVPEVAVAVDAYVPPEIADKVDEVSVTDVPDASNNV